jgi:hypothetical protein
VVSAELIHSGVAAAAVAISRMTAAVVVMLAGRVGGGRVWVETILAHTDGFCVILESANALWVTPKVHELGQRATVTMMHSKTARIVARTMGNLRCKACPSSSHHRIIVTGYVGRQTRLR